jgi:hypothetical protein
LKPSRISCFSFPWAECGPSRRWRGSSSAWPCRSWRASPLASGRSTRGQSRRPKVSFCGYETCRPQPWTRSSGRFPLTGLPRWTKLLANGRCRGRRRSSTRSTTRSTIAARDRCICGRWELHDLIFWNATDRVLQQKARLQIYSLETRFGDLALTEVDLSVWAFIEGPIGGCLSSLRKKAEPEVLFTLVELST